MSTPFIVTGAETRTTTAKVLGNIRKIYAGREAETFTVAKSMVDNLRFHWDSSQNIGTPDDPQQGRYWHNWTYKAVANMFFKAYRVGNNVGISIFYGTNLEYAQALETSRGALGRLMMVTSVDFLSRVRSIYEG